MTPRNDPHLSAAQSSQTLKDLSKQLGYDYTKLEKEGGRLWDTLNEFRANDPRAYEEFMFRTMQQMNFNPSMAMNEGGLSSSPEISSKAIPPFVPFAGFVVKTFIRPDGQKLFMNICHDDTAVPRPTDGDGKPVKAVQMVQESCRNLENLKIPLLVSKLRHCFDGNKTTSLAVDVVVSSWCIDVACKRDKRDSWNEEFKMQLVLLALRCVEKEHSIPVQARGHNLPWKIIKSKYKGGFGKGGSQVRPFEHQIKSDDPNNGNNNGANAAKKNVASSGKDTTITASPIELLKCREVQKDEEADAKGEGVLQMPQTKFSKSIKEHSKPSKPPLIQEMPQIPQTSRIPVERVAVTTTTTTTTSTTGRSRNSDGKDTKSSAPAPAPAIKPGFLNISSKKNALYPDGGSTGHGSSGTGGCYANFMSKCKVVDTADMAKIPIGRSGGKHSGEYGGHYDGEYGSKQTRLDPEFVDDVCTEHDPKFPNNMGETMQILSDLSIVMSEHLHPKFLNGKDSVDSDVPDSLDLRGKDPKSKTATSKVENNTNDGTDASESNSYQRNEDHHNHNNHHNRSNDKRIITRDVTTTIKDNQVTIQIDLSCCRPSIKGMNELDLQISETQLTLNAPRYQKRWKVEFEAEFARCGKQQPADVVCVVDVTTVRAKFRRKVQMLEVVCSLKSL